MPNKQDKNEQGYREMAEINLSFAQFCLDADNEQLAEYEEKLKKESGKK